ncbi:MAG: TylF/MycF family methyltransferase, partial [Phycisphaerae bacterium]|nr:TylF/MycF family methyltransferase [Phycisphaerae bacterium]
LSIPRSMEGDVVECGCFKGSSTSSLSLACALTGRRLLVCDSFEGLPEVAEHDRVHVTEVHERYEVYAKGEYQGRLDEVKSNVSRYGNVNCCEFFPGYFDKSLPGLKGRFAMVFLDVDLTESLKSCLTNLWPQMEQGAPLYTHEACQLKYVSLFFDDGWWRENVQEQAPGLIGAGCGLPTGLAQGSGIGYTRKLGSDPTASVQAEFTQFCGDPTLSKR